MVRPLEKFFSFGLWQKKSTQVVGIDIGSSSVKVVQLKKDKGQAVLETYGELAIGPYADLAVSQVARLNNEKTAQLLTDLFTEASVTAASCALAIPLRSSLLVMVTLPGNIPAATLTKVIPIEARKYVPVPISEVELDWWVIPPPAVRSEGGEKKTQVLVAAIHQETISQYRDISQAKGLTPAFFEIETFSALRAVFSGEMTVTVILDIGASTSKVTVVDYGIVRLSHTIGKGAQDITLSIARALGVDFAKAEEIKRRVGLVEHLEGGDISSTVNTIVEYIFSETNKVLMLYQEQQKRAVSKIVLLGGGALLKGLLEMAAKSFAAPVELGNPFAKTQAPAFLEKALASTGPGFAVATGLALRQLAELR
ncbi:MAG: type IV pilus assembly protein PilM [Patescibacteria group bacterium]